jgi:hypothetical protein
MDFMLNIELPKAAKLINHHQKILSVGSCFTEHIGNALTSLKFNVLQNPNGILFDPASVAASLTSYICNRQYTENDLFQLGEIWNSWTTTAVFLELINQKLFKKLMFLNNRPITF